MVMPRNFCSRSGWPIANRMVWGASDFVLNSINWSAAESAAVLLDDVHRTSGRAGLARPRKSFAISGWDANARRRRDIPEVLPRSPSKAGRPNFHTRGLRPISGESKDWIVIPVQLADGVGMMCFVMIFSFTQPLRKHTPIPPSRRARGRCASPSIAAPAIGRARMNTARRKRPFRVVIVSMAMFRVALELSLARALAQ